MRGVAFNDQADVFSKTIAAAVALKIINSRLKANVSSFNDNFSTNMEVFWGPSTVVQKTHASLNSITFSLSRCNKVELGMII